MEIQDYLSIAKRRWFLLVGIPILAGAVAALLLFQAPTTHTATATVNAPALVGGATGQYTGSQAVTQFVAAFQSTASGPAIASKVSKETGVGVNDFTNGLTVSQVGGSSAVTVTFTSPKKGAATAVVTAAAKDTLDQMFGSQVKLAQTQVDAATADLNKANAAINDWGTKNGMADPTRVYQAQLDRLNSLLSTQSSFQAQGNAAAASALGGTITDVRNGLAGFGPKMAEYNNLVAARDSAQNGLTVARQRQSESVQQQGAADPTQVTYVSAEQPVNRTDELVQIVAPVVGAGVLLAIALIAVLELLRSSRRARAARREIEAATADARTTAAGETEPRENELQETAAVPAGSEPVGDGALAPVGGGSPASGAGATREPVAGATREPAVDDAHQPAVDHVAGSSTSEPRTVTAGRT